VGKSGSDPDVGRRKGNWPRKLRVAAGNIRPSLYLAKELSRTGKRASELRGGMPRAPEADDEELHGNIFDDWFS